MKIEKTAQRLIDLENTFPFQNSTMQSIPSFRYFILSPTSDALRRISSYVFCENKTLKNWDTKITTKAVFQCSAS